MMISAILLLISTQADCRFSAAPPSDGGVAVLTLDLDGDPVPDEVRVLDRHVELRRSTPRSVVKLPLDWTGSTGELLVSLACHGVVLADLERDRHAWLYLLDQSLDKLRHQSIGEVTMSDGLVTIDLTLDMVEAPDCVQVRVRLDDGSIKIVKGQRPEHWREYEPKGPRCLPSKGR